MMLQCWHDSPGLRPSFSDLVSDLDRILGLCVSEVETVMMWTVHGSPKQKQRYFYTRIIKFVMPAFAYFHFICVVLSLVILRTLQ